MLPLVLAGPVIRRARPDQVLIWVATSRPTAWGVEIYSIDANRRPPLVNRGAPLGRGLPIREVKLGNKLYVSLVAVVPDATKARTFPTRQLLAYDLRELRSKGDWSSASGKGLAELTTLPDLCFAPMPLPTFVLQQDRTNDLRAIYSSCRKMHGKGSDAVRCSEYLVTRCVADARNRPSSMFLTGDQIYSDDVADPLIGRIAELGAELVGRDETLPDVPVASRKLKIGARQKLVQDKAHFTSGEAWNHLMAFGDFAAAYLLAWNPALWPTSYPSWSDVLLQGLDDVYREEFRPTYKFRQHYEDQLKSIREACDASRSLRRVLANVPTYMIFDDHEITDDWYLNADWRDTVLKTALGRRIIANGLAAYWGFQGWGNAPEEFDSRRFIEPLESYLGSIGSSGSNFETLMLDFKAWSFRAPTTPAAIFIDSRTQRERARATYDMRFIRLTGTLVPVPRPPFPRNILDVLPGAASMPRMSYPATLIGAAARARLRSLAKGLNGQPIILIAPAPVFGLESIEGAQNLLARFTGSYAFDLEHWRADPNSLLEFMDMVADWRADPCVILSGDVHYAFAAEVKAATPTRSHRVAQFTSSATKNQAPGLMAALGLEQTLSQMVGAANPFQLGRLWWRQQDGSTVRLQIQDPISAAEAVRLLAQRGPADLWEEVTFATLGMSNAFNTVLSSNNVGELLMSGGATRHRLYYFDGNNVRSCPEQRI